MASDLYVFDSSFFSDPFSPFSDSSLDILQTIPIPDEDIINYSNDNSNNKNPIQQNPVEEDNCLDQIAPTIFTSSPPTHQLENLSLCQATHLQGVPSSANQFADFSSSDEAKTEGCQVLPLPSPYNYQPFGPQSYGGAENNVAKMLQRSFSSSDSYNGKSSFSFQPRFDSLMETPNFQPQVLSSPENSYSTGEMRRVCSAGDLQKTKTIQTNKKLTSSPLAAESSFVGEANFQVERYSAEERQEKIHRYRAKRPRRNFNKTIKYACRKTLADNRPRIRGRFARNDETGEIPKAATEEDDLWVDGLNGDVEEETGAVGGGQLSFSNVQAPRQSYQYYGY